MTSISALQRLITPPPRPLPTQHTLSAQYSFSLTQLPGHPFLLSHKHRPLHQVVVLIIRRGLRSSNQRFLASTCSYTVTARLISLVDCQSRVSPTHSFVLRIRRSDNMMAPHAWAAGPRKRSREDDYADASMGGVSGFSEHRSVSLSRLSRLSRVISPDVLLLLYICPALPRTTSAVNIPPSETVLSSTFDGMLTPAPETPANLACSHISQRQEMASYTECLSARDPAARRLRL